MIQSNSLNLNISLNNRLIFRSNASARPYIFNKSNNIIIDVAIRNLNRIKINLKTLIATSRPTRRVERKRGEKEEKRNLLI